MYYTHVYNICTLYKNVYICINIFIYTVLYTVGVYIHANKLI